MKKSIVKNSSMVIAIAAIFMLSGCTNNREAARAIFLPVEVREHSVSVDYQNFPDEITLFFCANNFNRRKAELSEIVGDKVNNIEFTAHKVISDSLETIVFVEDCSGSMIPSIRRADRMISDVAMKIQNVEIALVRVGRESIVAVPPTKSSDLAKIDIGKLQYPSPRGTSLDDGIAEALDIIGEKTGAIILITDGSVAYSQKLLEKSRIAKSFNIPLIVMQIEGLENDLLKQISSATDGFFADNKGYSLAEILSNGWIVKYVPAVKDTNGAKHTVVIRWGAQKRVAEYIAPGVPPPPEPIAKTRTEPIIPAELVGGIRIPYIKPGNANILPETRVMLDSVVDLLEKTDVSGTIELAVDGYTCNLGSKNFNYDLSKRRAKSAANYIRQNCSKPIHFVITPHGENDPLLPNTSEKNRIANRRVEIRITYEQKNFSNNIRK